MKNIFQFIKENETRNEDDVTQEEFLEALLEIEEELDEFELEESVELDEGTKLKDAINLAKKNLNTSDRFTTMIGIFNKGDQFIPGDMKFRDKMEKDGYDWVGHVHKDGSVSLKKGFKESLDEKAPKIDLDKYAAHMNRNKKAVKKTSASQDYIKDVQKRSNKMGEAISMKNSINQYYYQDPKGVVQAVGSKDAMRKMNIKQAKDGNKGGSFSMNLKKYKVGDQIKESVEIDEATDFKSTFDDLKKGDIVKIKYGSSISKQQEGTFKVTFKSIVGKSKVGKITLVKQGEGAVKVKHYLYDRDGKVSMAMGDMGANMTSLVKESVEIDEASEEGKIRVVDLSSVHPNNRMGAKEKSGYQVQRMTKGEFVNQGKPYKKYADAKKVQQGTGQHSMQFEEKSGTGYELYHRDFSGAMGHAYAHAKKKFGITVDSDEIDDKVAMGPRKPGNGKTNTYRLKGDKGNIQVQVYNRGGSTPFELNMYKESVIEDAEMIIENVSPKQIAMLKKQYSSMPDRLPLDQAMKMSKMIANFDKASLMKVAKADIKWLSSAAKTNLISKHSATAKDFKESVELDEAKTPELKGNPFKYYKKPTNKKEAQSNVNFWHYVGMADNDEIEDMGKIPANYKSYAKSMKQDAQRELKKMNEAVVLDEASLIPQLQTIVKDKQHAKIKGMIVDTFTASMITQIYSKVNDANKAKMDKLPLEKLVNIAHKMMKK